jgi:uncharacterized protein YbjT (DUF2867 family)
MLLPGKTAKVCVTGASGFIALHLVETLLSKGHHVVAAVRGAGNSSKLAPLLQLQGAGKGSLEIAGNCDLLSPGAYDAAVAGCNTVFHTGT